MSDLNSKVIAIVRNYALERSAPVAPSTPMRGLGIDALDLPMIFLDLEDAVGASLTYDDEALGFETVADLIARVQARIEQQRVKALAPRPPKAKRGWMSTAAEGR